jgi:hypothetical protein
MKKNLFSLAFRLIAVLSCTLLVSHGNITWADEDKPEPTLISVDEPEPTLISVDAPSCSTIRDYLDCTSTGRQEDVVFVFDTTSSMNDEISQMQSAVIEFAETIATAGVDYNLGLTEYKDFPTEPCGKPDDIPYRVFNEGELTSDKLVMREWIESLSAKGGADIPESILAALAHTVEDQNWRSKSERIVIVITDAPDHSVQDGCNQEGNTLDSVISLLRREGIVTHVIGPNDTSMNRIARETGGSFFEIRSTENINSIIGEIAELLSCTYHIRSMFSYEEKDDVFKIETRLMGAEEKTIPYIEEQTKLTVTACRTEGDICTDFELNPETTESGETVYKNTGDVSMLSAPAELTDLSTLVQVCNFSTTTNAVLHIGQCVADETPKPNSPEMTISVDGNDAKAMWTTDPYARGYTFYYAPFPSADPITSFDVGLQTSIGGTLASGTSLYTAVQSANCSGDSGYSNIEVVEIP